MTNPAEDMVERVARAICNAHLSAAISAATGGQGRASGFPPSPADRNLARAVIAAMREPTDWMTHCSPVGPGNVVPYPETCAITWRAMIDAALSEPSK